MSGSMVDGRVDPASSPGPFRGGEERLGPVDETRIHIRF